MPPSTRGRNAPSSSGSVSFNISVVCAPFRLYHPHTKREREIERKKGIRFECIADLTADGLMTSKAAKSRCARSPGSRPSSISARSLLLLVKVKGGKRTRRPRRRSLLFPFFFFFREMYSLQSRTCVWMAGIPMATGTAHGTALNPEAMRTSHFLVCFSLESSFSSFSSFFFW